MLTTKQLYEELVVEFIPGVVQNMKRDTWWKRDWHVQEMGSEILQLQCGRKGYDTEEHGCAKV